VSRLAWFKFYPNDWRGDPALRMCSLAARGLWIDLISYMHEGEPYGHLTVGGQQPDMHGVAALVARPVNEVRKCLAELEAKQVLSRAESGAIYSRRMVRDKQKAERDAANGRDGGNPTLIKGVNPEDNDKDKAQIPLPEPRIQKVRSAKDCGIGKGKRDAWTPPRHGKTSQQKGRIYVEKASEEWKAYAEDYRAAHGVDPIANEHGGRWFNIVGEQTA
jgi:hypothetical protein